MAAKLKALYPKTCDAMVRGLIQLLKDADAAAPSETIELVDAVIQYCDAIDEITGSTTYRLDELINARADYSGPGIRRQTIP